jgi:hypothetical protein
VREAAVIGIPSAQWGESVHAVIVLKDGATATPDELTRTALADRRLQGPAQLRVPREPLPVTPSARCARTCCAIRTGSAMSARSERGDNPMTTMTMKRRLAITLLAASAPLSAIAQGGPIRLGVVNIEAGPLTVNATAINDGATLAVETLNAKGGALGRKYELVVQNHDGPPASAIAATTKLVQQQGVSFFTGLSPSGKLARGERQARRTERAVPRRHRRQR